MQSYYSARGCYDNYHLSIILSRDVYSQIGLSKESQFPLTVSYCDVKTSKKEKRLIILPKTNEGFKDLYELEVDLKREPGSTAAICGFFASQQYNIEWCQAIDSLYSKKGRVAFVIHVPPKPSDNILELETSLHNLIESNGKGIQQLLSLNEKKKFLEIKRRLKDDIFQDLNEINNKPLAWVKGTENEAYLEWDDNGNLKFTLCKENSKKIYNELGGGKINKVFFFVTIIVDSVSKSVSLVLKHVDEWVLTYELTFENRPSILYQFLQLFYTRGIDLRVIEPESLNPDRPKYLIAGNIKYSDYRYYSVKTLEPLIIGDLIFNNPALLNPDKAFHTGEIIPIKINDLKIKTKLTSLCLSGRDIKLTFNLVYFDIYKKAYPIFNVYSSNNLDFEPIFLTTLKNEGITEELILSFGKYQKQDHLWENISDHSFQELNQYLKYTTDNDSNMKSAIDIYLRDLTSANQYDFQFHEETIDGKKYWRYFIDHFSLLVVSTDKYKIIMSWTCEISKIENFMNYIKIASGCLLDKLEQGCHEINKETSLYFFLAELIKEQISQEGKKDSSYKTKEDENIPSLGIEPLA